MPVRELQERMDSAEFAEWVAFYRTNPFGYERTDLNAAVVAMTIANTSRDKKTAAFKVDEFMPEFDRPEPQRQTAEQMQSILGMHTNARKVKVIDGNNRNTAG